jgi:hypothetical protein
MSTLLIAVARVSAGEFSNRFVRLFSSRFGFKKHQGVMTTHLGPEDDSRIFKTSDESEAIAELDRSFRCYQHFGCHIHDSVTLEEISLSAEGNELVLHLYASMALLKTDYEQIFRDVVIALGYKPDKLTITME